MKSKKNRTIAEQLKQYRLQKEWTLAQVAGLTGLNLASVWKIENGKVKPHERTVAKLKRTLPGFEAAA
jgi:transcriptional regulator with XRE-family HTH domain